MVCSCNLATARDVLEERERSRLYIFPCTSFDCGYGERSRCIRVVKAMERPAAGLGQVPSAWELVQTPVDQPPSTASTSMVSLALNFHRETRASMRHGTRRVRLQTSNCPAPMLASFQRPGIASITGPHGQSRPRSRISQRGKVDVDNLYSLPPTLSAPWRDTSSLSFRLAVSCSASVVVIVVGRVVLVGFERQSSASNNQQL